MGIRAYFGSIPVSARYGGERTPYGHGERWNSIHINPLQGGAE